ncbi:MAG TPA: tetratricopeptide repeat protein [Cyanobacteria bacterium UBA11372]|nr:tetratricopeptide repeat protein [Cyanobacteria bacterium UBA11372]
MPYGTRHFVGRQQELAQLHQTLQNSHRVAISAVAGMGGVGKTELAIKYAREHQDDYPGGICWLSARDANLAEQILQFAQLSLKLEVPQQDWQGNPLSLAQQVAWCWQQWQPPQGRVLVVLDDVTDWKLCRGMLPTDNRFCVLMTTRLRRLDPNFVELPLNVLSEAEALQLLTAILGENDRRLQRESETAKELCWWLGYLPLGLELVARYLVEDPDLSLAEMWQRLQAKSLQDKVIDKSEADLDATEMTARRGVKAAFELSWQELEKQTQRVGELLSLFAPAAFAWEWVESASESLNWAKSEVNEAKKRLHKRHLIERVEEREACYKIHPLIREFLRLKLDESEQADNVRQAFVPVFVEIAKGIPESPTIDLIESVKFAIPHLEEVAENLTNALSNEDLISPFVGLGTFYEGQGSYSLAEPWRRQCLSVVKTRLGEDHPVVAESLNNLASLYDEQGRYSEAEQLYLQALELRKRLLGEDHSDVAESLNNLALIYNYQGRYSEAEPLFLQALELKKRLLGEDHPDVATSLNNLALLYYSQGCYSEADPLFLQALDLRKRLLGEDHLLVAQNYNNLAYLYYSLGRYSEAETLYLQALELKKRLLGENHTDVATSLNNLALLYEDQGRYSEAETLYLQALELRKRLLGEDHPYVATSLNNLAYLYNSQGRYSEAEPLYLQALELRKRLLGEDHPDVAESYNNLALLYEDQRRYSEAETLFLQSLKLSKILLGEDHPHVAFSLNNLAKLYYFQGRYSEGEPLYLQALEIVERVLGVNHPRTVSIRENLASLRDAIAS